MNDDRTTASDGIGLPLHGLLTHAVNGLAAPTADVTAAVLAEARVRRRRRRAGAALAGTACVLALAAGVSMGPDLPGSHGKGTVAAAGLQAQRNAYYPVGALQPGDVTGLRPMVFATRSPTGLPPGTAVPADTSTRGTYYTFSRHGSTGYLSVVTHDPSRSRAPVPFSTATHCTTPPVGTVARGSGCRTLQLPGGATALISTQAPSGATGPNTAPSITVAVTYPDTRVAVITVLSSFHSPTKVTTAPLLTQDEVLHMAASQDWFSPASVN